MAKKYVSFLCNCFFIVQFSFAQSPGGIATNNKMWVRSDNGTTTTGTTVTQWQEASGANVTGNFIVSALAGTANAQSGPTLVPAGVNFNPYLRFNGTNNSLSSTNNFLGTSLVGNNTVTVFQVVNLKSGVVWLKWETDQLGTTARLGFENSSGRLRFDFPRANPANTGQNAGVTTIQNLHTLSTCYANATTSVNRLNGLDDRTISIPGPGNFAAANTKIVIGNENLLNLPCQIDVAEIIIYSTTLTAAERNRIESYLAVKYGFTLNQAAANNNNYVATNSTIIWDRALNSGYANNITGIGRDDATALLQKQSKSVQPNALITLYNSGNYTAGNFPVQNSDNTNGFSNNFSYLLVGDNGSPTTMNQCVLNGRAQRMQRIWKTSKTGTVAPVTVSIDQSTAPANIRFILASADPGFPTAGTTLYPVTIANGKIYSTVNLNHNDYFTFATDTVAIPQLQSTPVCPGTTSTLVVTNPVTGATYNWYSAATGGTSLASGSSYGTVINSNATFYVEMTTPLNCVVSPRTSVIATVSNSLNVRTNNDTSVCSGKPVPVTTISNGTSFSWSPAIGVSNPSIANPVITPLVSTQYIITASLNNCVGKDTLNITVLPAPIVNAGPDLISFLGVGVTLQGFANTNAVLWTPNTSLNSNNILNPVATPTATTQYKLTGTGSNGCSSSDSMIVTFIADCIKPMKAFTPNGDGIHDLWVVSTGFGCVTKIEAVVFNRYGGKVYESKDYRNNWDGTYNKKPVTDGTYYYVLFYHLIDGRVVQHKGDVTVLR